MWAIPDVFAEFERRDMEKPYVELIDGIEVPKMSPATRHGLLQQAFLRVLGPWAESRGICGPEIRFWLGDDADRVTSLLPDVAFVSFERLAPLDDNRRERIPFAPDLAVEIRSAGDRERNVARKIELYLAYGASVVLDVDPSRERIVAHDGVELLTFARGDRFTHTKLPEFAFDVGEFFDRGSTRRP